MQTITLFDFFGYNQFRDADLQDTTIDASSATWIVSNMGDDLNRYPVLITDSENVVLKGGVIDGTVPLDLDWQDAYVNSAAVFARDSDEIEFVDWTISEAWDGIRISGDDEATFSVENVWLSNIRDDGIENDRGLSGSIKDVLMDGVFVGISLYEDDTADQTDQTVSLDNVLIRMESFQYRGEETHQPFFKFEDGVSPNLSIQDSVFALDKVDHREYGRLQDAWDSVTHSENNYLLNLSDDPLPDDYPLPPEGFTILQGDEARTFWEESRDDWLAEFRGIDVTEPIADTAEPEILPDQEVVDDPVKNDTNTSDEAAAPRPDQSPEESQNLFQKFFDMILSLFGGGDDDEEYVVLQQSQLPSLEDAQMPPILPVVFHEDTAPLGDEDDGEFELIL